MHNPKMICAIAAILPMLLSGCVTESKTVAAPSDLGRVCPMPTPMAKLTAIADYLENAPPSPGLNVLSTEWERLDEGARKARGQ